MKAISKPAQRIIVALDRIDSIDQVLQLVGALKGEVGGFKLGLQAFTRCGPAIVESICRQGERVFLDLKFHDIPSTVRDAAREAARLGVYMFNVHGSGGRAMLQAAVEGAHLGARDSGVNPPKVLAVTVLTSLSDGDLNRDIGIVSSVDETVIRLAKLAKSAGLDGVVASAKEVKSIKQHLGNHFLVVTPGIRPRWAAPNDQARVVTPADAVADGADFLVIGRAILSPPPPLNHMEAVRKIRQELEQ